MEKRINDFAAEKPRFDVFNERTPAQFVANQDNYDPGNYDVLRISSDASRTVSGFSDGRKGRILHLVNVGSNDIVLAHESASSTAANRLLISSHADATLLPGQTAMAYYDDTTQRWRVLNRAVTPTTGQVYGSAFSFASYYLNGPMQLESTYVPAPTSSATLVHTNNTNRRVNKEIMRAGEYLYWMERVGLTWYITEYNITTTAETQIAVSALSNPTTSFWCVTEERIVYYLKIDTSTQNDIYKLDFSAGTNTLFDQFASNVTTYFRSGCNLISSTYIASEQYLVICGGISVTPGMYGYRKNLTTGAANVITDAFSGTPSNTLYLGGQWCGTKVYVAGKPSGTYPTTATVSFLGYCYDVENDTISIGNAATLAAKAYECYFSVANNEDGKFYWYIYMTDSSDKKYYYLFNMNASGTAGITYQSADDVASPNLFGLFQNRTRAYYYTSNNDGVDTGSFYTVDGSSVRTAPADFNPAPFYIGKRDMNIDDNTNVWYWKESTNELRSINIASGAEGTYSYSVTDATSSPTNNKMSILGNYFVLQTYFNGGVTSNIYLLK